MDFAKQNKKEYVRPVVRTKVIALGVFGDYTTDHRAPLIRPTGRGIWNGGGELDGSL